MSKWGDAAGIAPGGSRSAYAGRKTAYGVDGEVRARSGRLLGDPLVQAVNDGCVGGVLDLALVRQRGGNCRYSDLAIAAVEIRLVAAGVIVELRRIVLGHLLLRGSALVCLIGAARHRDDGRLRPKCAANCVLS